MITKFKIVSTPKIVERAYKHFLSRNKVLPLTNYIVSMPKHDTDLDFALIEITAKDPDKGIDLKDIFFLGLFSGNIYTYKDIPTVEKPDKPEKKTNVFDLLDNVLGNYADGSASADDVIMAAMAVNDYCLKNPHPDDSLKQSEPPETRDDVGSI